MRAKADLENVKKQKEKIKQALAENLKRCLLLPQSEKDFWFDRIEKLPLAIMENVLKLVKAKNDLMDGYIKKALANDPERKYLRDLKAKVEKIQKSASELEHSTEVEGAEESLEKQLKQV